MSTHTPGPWNAQHNGTCWQVDAETDAVATTQFCYAVEAEANVRLIAAAPDMLAALQSIRPHLAAYLADLIHSVCLALPDGTPDLDSMDADDAASMAEERERLALVDAAIARATGEQS